MRLTCGDGIWPLLNREASELLPDTCAIALHRWTGWTVSGACGLHAPQCSGHAPHRHAPVAPRRLAVVLSEKTYTSIDASSWSQATSAQAAAWHPQVTPKARSRPGLRRVLACLTAAVLGLLTAALIARIRWLRGPSGGSGALHNGGSGVTALDECLLGGRAGKRERLFLFVGAHGRALVEAADWAARVPS